MIGFETDGSLATITLNRPPVNAIDEEHLDALGAAVDQVAADDSLSVLLIQAEGSRFSAGADISKLREWAESADGATQQERFASSLQRTFGRIADLPIPSVAAVSGAATGGGLELALACDLRVVGDDAHLGLTEVRLGLVPGAGGTQRLTEIVGRGTALRLMLRGELVTGAETHRMGLAEFCVPICVIHELSSSPPPPLSSPSSSFEQEIG